MGLSDGLDDAQPDARPRVPGRHADVEDRLAVGLRNPRPVVGDEEPLAVGQRPDDDGGVVAAVLDRVVEGVSDRGLVEPCSTASSGASATEGSEAFSLPVSS